MSNVSPGPPYPNDTGGNTLIAIGDSIVADSGIGTIWETLAMYSGGKFRPIRNAGVASQQSHDFLQRVWADVINYRPDWCWVQTSPNDFSAGLTLTQTINNYKAIITQLRRAGVRPILALAPPNDTPANNSFVRQVSAYLIEWAAIEGVPVIDLWTPLVDVVDGSFAAAFTSDGLHPNLAGIVAAAIYNRDRLPPGLIYRPNTVATTSVDPTNMAPSGGQFAVDTNADGISDGLTSAGAATFTRTAFADGSGRIWQNITPTSTAMAQLFFANVAGFIVGQTYEVSVKVKANVCGLALGVSSPVIQLPGNPGVGVIANAYTIAEANAGVISFRFVPTGTTSHLQMQAESDGLGGMASFAGMTCRNVTALAAI